MMFAGTIRRYQNMRESETGVEIDDKLRKEALRIGEERKRHCAPAIILPSVEARSNEIINSGTLSLVETPTQRIFVTAFHVWREFERIRKNIRMR